MTGQAPSASASPGTGRGAAPDTGRVVVVMSTYNGARYVDEQVDSIRAQSLDGWTLLVRDDGSTDDTRARLDALGARDPRIVVLPHDGRNLRAPGGFGELLARAFALGGEYVFLADQDDVWLPDKLELQLAAVRELEARHGRTTPVLVHSDAEIVGLSLEPVHPSMAAYQHMPGPGARRLSRLLAQNVVTGCTTVVNRALLEFALPVPRVVMHDWWLAQCAAAVGYIEYMPQPTVRYRQHHANVVGARGFGGIARAAAQRPRAWWDRGFALFGGGVDQVDALARRLEATPLPRAAEAARTAAAYVSALRTPGSAARRLARVSASGVRPDPTLFYLIFLARVAAYRPAPAPTADVRQAPRSRGA